jgi:hypothetical protein
MFGAIEMIQLISGADVVVLAPSPPPCEIGKLLAAQSPWLTTMMMPLVPDPGGGVIPALTRALDVTLAMNDLLSLDIRVWRMICGTAEGTSRLVVAASMAAMSTKGHWTVVVGVGTGPEAAELFVAEALHAVTHMRLPPSTAAIASLRSWCFTMRSAPARA